MEDTNRQRILRHLQDEEVQARIYSTIERVRNDVTITIGRASELFGFKESKLREMQSLNLLSPIRKESGQRQYTRDDLDKLAIIRELIDAKYGLQEIPNDIDILWRSMSSANARREQSEDGSAFAPIDVRIESEQELVFWRYYAPQALRMSLMLIRENLPNTTVGLILPLHRQASEVIPTSDTVSILGESLVGWLKNDGSTHILYTPCPSFQFPTDYAIYPLARMVNDEWSEGPEDATLIILERPDKRLKKLTLNIAFVKLIRRLLSRLYQEASIMRACFGPGMRDERVSATDISEAAGFQDVILEGLADLIIWLGGKTAHGEDRWRFCTILLPDTTIVPLPLQQRSLVTRAQSARSPYVSGTSIFSPEKSKTSVSIRAFQSGRIIYRPELSLKERLPVFVDVEGDIQSNIAVPIGAESGQPVGVLYVASDELHAFTKEDQQFLRVIGRFIENMLNTYNSRLQVTQDLRSLMRTPEVVDIFFNEFLSENSFMRDLEALLANVHVSLERDGKGMDEESGNLSDRQRSAESHDVISFIGLDVDDQESIASRYGDQIMRHLSKTVGLRLQEYIISLVTRYASCQMYYMYASRFYLILRGFSLEKAREVAEKLQRSLSGSISLRRSEISDSVLIIPDITVHLAVSSYRGEKLRQMLEEASSVVDISTKISQQLDSALKLGLDQGGNVIIAFDPAYRAFKAWGVNE
jgi:DNA-binding transcriptional MerR regulator/GGDEF domain-containing protein